MTHQLWDAAVCILRSIAVAFAGLWLVTATSSTWAQDSLRPEPLLRLPSLLSPLPLSNPLRVRSRAPEQLWWDVTDVVDDSYPIERNEPPISMSGAFSARLQTCAVALPQESSLFASQQRQWVLVSAWPEADGYLIQVESFVETKSSFRDVSFSSPQWRLAGRDATDEQRILQSLAQRFAVSPRPVVPATFGSEPPTAIETVPPPALWRRLGKSLISDTVNYYSVSNFFGLTGAFGVGAVVANTSTDESLREAYHNHLGYQSSIHAMKDVGDGRLSLTAMGAIMATGLCFQDRPWGSTIEEFGERGLRATIVGAPPMLLMQQVTGAARPGESPSGSHWQPFKDANGVSGHAFIGAIPFIAAAKMTDQPVLKTALYAASTLTGLSRINDDAHYPSQVFLGWAMSYAAATAVDHSYRGKTRSLVVPWNIGTAQGFGIEYRR